MNGTGYNGTGYLYLVVAKYMGNLVPQILMLEGGGGRTNSPTQLWSLLEIESYSMEMNLPGHAGKCVTSLMIIGASLTEPHLTVVLI